jgi:hypothetical protein
MVGGWTPVFIESVFLIVQKPVSDTLLILMELTFPLQGFFNFVVFMAPKVRNTRTMAMWGGRTGSNDKNSQNRQHLTWCQALHMAYMSRGRRLEDRNMRNNNRTERRGDGMRATIRKMNGTFRTAFESLKQPLAMMFIRILSPENTDTNECSESGTRSAAVSP